MSRCSNHFAPFGTQVILLLACSVLNSQDVAADHHTWKVYTNVRFSYKICYPEDLLVPQGEAENSDGQTFLAKDGAKLLVFGRNNTLSQSVKEVVDDTSSRLASAQGKVTYEVIKPNWFVVSGQDKQTVFYAKTLYLREQFKSFEITYENSTSAVYKPVIDRIVSCFADLKR